MNAGAVVATSLLVLTACCAQRAVAQQAVSTTVTVHARELPARFLLWTPPPADSAAAWPLLLYLHGGSHRGTDISRLAEYGVPKRLADGWTPPFIVVAPQLPEGEIWSDADYLIALIDDVARRHPVDPARIYVAGISMGARGAWYLAWRHPERIAAIAPVAVYQPILHWATSGRLRDVAVYAVHGSDDDVAPVGVAVALDEALRAAGGRSSLHVLEGRGHGLADVLHGDAIYQWLLSQRKPHEARDRH